MLARFCSQPAPPIGWNRTELNPNYRYDCTYMHILEMQWQRVHIAGCNKWKTAGCIIGERVHENMMFRRTGLDSTKISLAYMVHVRPPLFLCNTSLR